MPPTHDSLRHTRLSHIPHHCTTSPSRNSIAPLRPFVSITPLELLEGLSPPAASASLDSPALFDPVGWTAVEGIHVPLADERVPEEDSTVLRGDSPSPSTGTDDEAWRSWSWDQFVHWDGPPVTVLSSEPDVKEKRGLTEPKSASVAARNEGDGTGKLKLGRSRRLNTKKSLKGEEMLPALQPFYSLTTNPMASFALGDLSNRPPQYQNQYTLVNQNGRLRFAAISRRALALPPELLAEIFLWCLPPPRRISIAPEVWELPVSPNPNAPPLVFCAVCRQWRRVALRTPALWGFLMFSDELPYSEAGAEYAEFCRTWFSKAGATPISFDFTMDSSKTLQHRSTQVLHTLLGQLHQQWCYVQLTRNRRVPNWLQLPSNGKYPFLEVLQFSPAASDPPLSFCDAPRLYSVVLYEYTTRIQLPWRQLTSLRTYEIEVSACLKILRDAPNLVDVTFGDIDDDKTPPANNAITLLSNIRYLHLGNGPYTGPTPITTIKSLTTPALEGLTLQFCALPEFHTTSPILSFISRSSCRLRRLALWLPPAGTKALIGCLEAVPSLVNLKLHPLPRVDTQVLFSQFTQKPEFLPALETLYLVFPKSGIAGVSSATAPLIVDMLCWRRSATQLQEFHLLHDYQRSVFQTEVQLNSKIRRLRSEGMTLRMGEWDKHESFMDGS
ncbi:hypothetical protein B0H16DRAFT_1453818 [Mycena metata]|uniref:F-box domain-containing protein n=1 Tax=Mycena metata TaxID=1033252 RepID=A0AAD7NLG9_9AGAR|nr:hypothetical protein B0H16DRAFT_1453818 [Mycena metata]